MEKAEELKKSYNLEIPKGNKKPTNISSMSLLNIAGKIGIDIEDEPNDSYDGSLEVIISLEEKREQDFLKNCQTVVGSYVNESEELPSDVIEVVNISDTSYSSVISVETDSSKVDFNSKEVSKFSSDQGADPESPRAVDRTDMSVLDELEEKTWTKVLRKKEN